MSNPATSRTIAEITHTQWWEKLHIGYQSVKLHANKGVINITHWPNHRWNCPHTGVRNITHRPNYWWNYTHTPTHTGKKKSHKGWTIIEITHTLGLHTKAANMTSFTYHKQTLGAFWRLKIRKDSWATCRHCLVLGNHEDRNGKNLIFVSLTILLYHLCYLCLLNPDIFYSHMCQNYQV